MLAAATSIGITLCAIAIAQQRDTRVTPVGSGEIRGVVRTAEAVPRPVRRAVVSIAGGGLVDPRSTITDDDGRFSFDRLPAGSFTVTARKAAFLQATHGATRPGRAGSPVALTDGQHVDINLTMFKGAVISGIVRDASGQPLPGVPVAVIDKGAASRSGQSLMDPAFTSDERGVFRIYGLMPGTYAVAAIPSAGRSPLTASTSAEIDARLARLGQPQNQFGPSKPVGTPPPPRPVAFAPTFFPGTTLYTDAGLVRVQAGEERDGVDFELSHVPVARIEGLISGDVPDVSAVELTIINPGLTLPLGFGAFAITTTAPSTLGQFSYANVPPGRYRIVARARRDDPAMPKPPAPAGAARGGGGGGGSTVTVRPGGVASSYIGEQLFAFADVDVRGEDVRGVALALRPGGSIAGQIAFDATTATKPENLGGIQVALSVIGGTYSASGSGGTVSGNALMGLSPVTADVNGNFRITGIGPTSYSLSVLLPATLSKTWAIRSATIGGRDLLDETIDGPFVDLSGVTITLSDTRTELSGTLQLAGGQPAAEYFVIVFSADRRHWQPESRRSKSTRPATDGRFVFADLPAGEYLLAALADLEPAGWQEAQFLDLVAPAAIRITLAHGEKRVQDLRVR